MRQQKTRSAGFFLCVCVMAGILSGCGGALQSDISMISIEKKGSVKSLEIEELDQSYYDETELHTFIEDAVTEYTASNGADSIKVEDYTVTDGVVNLHMDYATTTDYGAFNGIELYQGKVVNAMADGYSFSEDCVSVADGILGSSVKTEDITSDTTLYAVIIKENIKVRVPGTICYVSKDYVEMAGKDTVVIDNGQKEADAVTYILYK